MSAAPPDAGRRIALTGRAIPAAQCLLGAALLSWPGPIRQALRGPSDPEPPQMVVRLLAVRMLVQGAVTAARAGPGSAWVSAGVDATHATSMLLLAAATTRYRRAALISAAVAAASAAASARVATTARARHR
jgi:hypothetical protein